MGIRHATEGLGQPVLLTCENSDVFVEDAVQLIQEMGVEVVHIGGIPKSIRKLVDRLNALSIRVVLSYHGSMFQLEPNSYEQEAVMALIGDVQTGRIPTLGIVKGELIPILSALNISAQFLQNPVHGHAGPFRGMMRSLGDGQLHVGILGSWIYRKNVLSQIMSVCALPGIVIHHLAHPVWESTLLSLCTAPRIAHPAMSHRAFVRLVSQMDIVMYISHSECQPMVCLESIARGVPCVAGDVSLLYEGDAHLQDLLSCPFPDSPRRMRDCVQRLIPHLGAPLSNRLVALSKMLLYTSAVTFSQLANVSMERLYDPLILSHEVDYTTLYAHAEGGAEFVFQSELAQLERTSTYGMVAMPQRVAGGGDVDVRAARTSAPPTILFATYEIDGVTQGGAGTLISALTKMLAKNGVRVILLVDIDMRLWRERIKANRLDILSDPMISVLFIHDYLTPEMRRSDPNAHPAGVFCDASQRWAMGIRSVAATRHIDVVEFVEYAGAASVMLADPHPGDPPIVIRMHGGMEMIHAVEHYPLSTPTTTMMDMERYALSQAPVVLSPSMALGRWVSLHMGVRGDRVLVAPPPMEDILAEMASPPRTRQCMADGVFRMVVPGRVAHVKNVAMMTRAFDALFQRVDGLEMSLVFIGLKDTADGKAIIREVEETVREDVRSRIRFLDPLQRSELAAVLTKDADVAVFGSRFESFHLAVHEAYHLGVPLIVSTMSAYQDYFHDQNAAVFQHGSEQSLTDAMERVLQRCQRGDTSPPPPLDYGNPLEPYHHIIRSQPWRRSIKEDPTWLQQWRKMAQYACPPVGLGGAGDHS